MSNVLVVTQELLYLLWALDAISDEIMDDYYLCMRYEQLKGDDK